jgi:hypothetical protein
MQPQLFGQQRLSIWHRPDPQRRARQHLRQPLVLVPVPLQTRFPCGVPSLVLLLPLFMRRDLESSHAVHQPASQS